MQHVTPFYIHASLAYILADDNDRFQESFVPRLSHSYRYDLSEFTHLFTISKRIEVIWEAYDKLVAERKTAGLGINWIPKRTMEKLVADL